LNNAIWAHPPEVSPDAQPPAVFFEDLSWKDSVFIFLVKYEIMYTT